MRPSRALMLLLSLMAGLWSPPAGAQAKKTLVAVFDMELRAPLNRRARANLRDYLADRLAADGLFRVLPRGRLARHLAQQRPKRGQRSCHTLDCQRAAGKALGAQATLATRVMKIGSWCVVTVTLQWLAHPSEDRVATTKGRCGEDGVLASVERVVGRLMDHNKQPPPAAQRSAARGGGRSDRALASLAVVALAEGRPVPASVFLDGRRVARTPALLSGLKPGTCRLRLSSPGFKSVIRSLRLRAGQQVRVSVSLVR